MQVLGLLIKKGKSYTAPQLSLIFVPFGSTLVKISSAPSSLKASTIVATVMSNLGFEYSMNKKGIKLIRSQVGDRYVMEDMLKLKHYLIPVGMFL